jgi:hypothetical protein
MAGKSISAKLLTVLAFVSNSMSSDLVTASFNTVGEGVVRIDLERKYLQHIDAGSVQLDDKLDINLTIEGPNID